MDPAVRAKDNWLRLYNKVLEQLREVRVQVYPNLQSSPPQRSSPSLGGMIKLHPVIKNIYLSSRDSKSVHKVFEICMCSILFMCKDRVHAASF